MAGKADFTDQEWETLQKGVAGAALLVAVAEPGFLDTFKEMRVLAEHLAEAKEKSDSPLIRQLAEVDGAGFGVTASAQEVEQETIAALRSAMSTLQAKAPGEVERYRTFVLDVAESVAAAAKDVGAEESGAIEKVRSALH
jgi:hypothetical protein